MAEKLAHDLEWIADRSIPLYLRTLASMVRVGTTVTVMRGLPRTIASNTTAAGRI